MDDPSKKKKVRSHLMTRLDGLTNREKKPFLELLSLIWGVRVIKA